MDDEWAYGGYRCNLTAANAGNALLENLVVSACVSVSEWYGVSVWRCLRTYTRIYIHSQNSPGNDPVVVGLGIRTHVDNTSDAWMR
jgi:hypothetical protein